MSAAQPAGHPSNSRIIQQFVDDIEEHVHMGRKNRAQGLRKALYALRRHPNAITTFQEAVSVASVGDKLAVHIMAIVGGKVMTKALVAQEKEKEKARKQIEKDNKALQRRLEREANKPSKCEKQYRVVIVTIPPLPSTTSSSSLLALTLLI